jgi:hypothetical protein
MLLAGGLALLICVTLAVGRALGFGRRATMKIGDLTVSRTWLIEHSARKSD